MKGIIWNIRSISGYRSKSQSESKSSSLSRNKTFADRVRLHMKQFGLFFLACSTTLSMWAQNDYPRHNINLGLGAGIPSGELKQAFQPSFSLGVEYGYRFLKNFQADIGLDTIFQAARVNEYVDSGWFGYRRIRDYQTFIPFGGRVLLPLAGERMQFFAGGGGVYARYYEAISQPSPYIRLACPYCASRSGTGYYGLAGFRFTPFSSPNFYMGGSVRMVRVTTDGDDLGTLQLRPSRDRWITPRFEIGFSF